MKTQTFATTDHQMEIDMAYAQGRYDHDWASMLVFAGLGVLITSAFWGMFTISFWGPAAYSYDLQATLYIDGNEEAVMVLEENLTVFNCFEKFEDEYAKWGNDAQLRCVKQQPAES